MVKNLDARRRRNRKMVKLYWKISEYNTVEPEDNNGSLEARQGKNIVWGGKRIGLVIFWKRNRKIGRNGMREMKNVN